MSENQLEDYMAGYMSEDDDTQPQSEIHDSDLDESSASDPDHSDIPPPSTNRTFQSSKEAMEFINNGIYRSRINEGHRVRQKSSRLSDCPFRAALRRRKGFDYWTLEVTNEQHNHGPASAHTHPTLRRVD